MTELKDATDAQLIAELARRGRNPRCRCQRWQTYLGAYDHDATARLDAHTRAGWRKP